MSSHVRLVVNFTNTKPGRLVSYLAQHGFAIFVKGGAAHQCVPLRWSTKLFRYIVGRPTDRLNPSLPKAVSLSLSTDPHALLNGIR